MMENFLPNARALARFFSLSLMLILVLQCKGQTVEKPPVPSTRIPINAPQKAILPPPINGTIRIEWDSTTEYYVFRNNSGGIVKKVTAADLTKDIKYYHLPVASEYKKHSEGGPAYYDLTKLSKKEKSKLSSKTKIASAEQLNRTELIFCQSSQPTLFGMTDGGTGRYLLLETYLSGERRDSIHGTFSKTLIQVLDCNGKTVKEVELDGETGAHRLSNDLRFIVYETGKTYLYDEVESFRERVYLEDLKTRQKFLIPVEFNKRTFADHPVRFIDEKYFSLVF